MKRSSKRREAGIRMSPPQQTFVTSADESQFPASPPFAYPRAEPAARKLLSWPGTSREYISPAWSVALERNQLNSFREIWEVESQWFEPVNKRRGGWSGASRIEITAPDGSRRGLFLKRQERHFCRTLKNPLQRTPTYLREYNNLKLCRRLGIPTPKIVYFGLGPERAKAQAILITEELYGYRSIKEWLADPASEQGNLRMRRRIMRDLGRLTRKLHSHQLQHHALKPNNIFVKIDRRSGEPSLCLLDLEMMRWHPRPAYRDLLTLYRKTANVSNGDRMAFFLAYLGLDKLNVAGARLWRKLAARYLRKAKRALPSVPARR